MEASYNEGLTDEFVVPFIVEDQNDGVNDGDAVIFYNFRPDRAAQLSEILRTEHSKDLKLNKLKTYSMQHSLSIMTISMRLSSSKSRFK